MARQRDLPLDLVSLRPTRFDEVSVMIKSYGENTTYAAEAAMDDGRRVLRLLIADDSSTVRQALLSLVAGTEIRVVAEAADGQQAFTLTMLHAPDVVLLDIRM